ncbi:MAG: hypothetical protein H7Z75_09520 [Ferruginibacter sp.]|nr:hypothetical protein [Cytophagales bacterium]
MAATSLLRALLLPLMTFVGLPVFAQNSVADALYTRRAPSDSLAPVSAKRVRFGMELGTSFTSFRGGTGLQTFVSPYLSYRVSPRWTFSAGTTLVNGRYGFPTGDARYAPSPSSQQVYLFAQGQYQATERLRITGTSFYETSRWGQPAGKSLDFNRKGMSVLAEYKVSEHFSFGVGARFSDGYSPYNSFGSSRFGTNGFGYRPQYPGW